MSSNALHTARKGLLHDRHTVSLLPNYMTFSPKYRRKILVGDVMLALDSIIRKTCKDLGIEIIDMAVNSDHVHLFVKYPPKYSVSYIAKRIKGRSSRELRKAFPHLKEWCSKSLWAPSCFHGSAGQGWEVVESCIQNQEKPNAKTLCTGIGLKSGV
ncbi:MAG: IS200/IS605 family transposase [Euryarchaeota archaeon]|nr:IS200/IS605 family transposase [Euryarchaeota archaeon]